MPNRAAVAALLLGAALACGGHSAAPSSTTQNPPGWTLVFADEFDPLAIHGSIHTAAYNHTIGTQKTAIVSVTNPWDNFHVYSMEWYADRIDVLVDGQKYFTFRNEGTGSREWPFDKPQYLLINLAIGGSWGGQKGIDDSRFPHRYFVDYVRISQQK